MNILENIEVEYVTFEGWKVPISECRTFEALPENAKKYLKFIEQFLEVPSKSTSKFNQFKSIYWQFFCFV